jgi:chorismate mutase
MEIQAIRGATQIAEDNPEMMREAVVELMAEILRANALQNQDLISVIFTATQDLVSDFPAASARAMGLGDVPLLCAVEIAVPGSMQRVIRALIHCRTTRSQKQMVHVYLRGTNKLRNDLAQ